MPLTAEAVPRVLDVRPAIVWDCPNCSTANHGELYLDPDQTPTTELAAAPPGTKVIGLPDGVACSRCQTSYAVGDVTPAAAPAPPPAFLATEPAFLLPTLQAAGPPPMTIGDYINAEVAADADKTTKTAAAVAADAAAKTAVDAELKTRSALGAALVKSGTAYTQAQDGTIVVYASDGQGDFHVTTPKPASTVVEPDPAPPAA